MLQTRRSFFQHLTAATAGAVAASYAKPATAQAVNTRTEVNLVSGADRRETVYNAIKPFKAVIEEGIQNKRVFVKVNNVYHGNPLCATHPDAIRAMLDLLKEVTDRQIVVAESTASPNGTLSTFEEYGYLPLEKEYNIRFYDLNTGTSTTKWIHDQKLMPVSIEIIDEFLMSDIYWISMAMPKTHDSAIGTAGFKNMVMGSPLNVPRSDPRFTRNQAEKMKMHAGRNSLGFNWNMFEVGQYVRPDFVVIDGHRGMEGRGPISGTPVEHNIALAGPDVIAVDRSTFECMGIPYEDVGYLQWSSNAGVGQGSRDMIDYIGADPADHVITYESHPNLQRELEWKLGGINAEG